MLLQLFVLAIALLFVTYILKMVSKNQLLIHHSLIWLLLGLTMVVFAIFPHLPGIISNALGFELPLNFLMFISIIFLFVQLFSVTSASSKKNETIKILVQEVSLLKNKQSDKE